MTNRGTDAYSSAAHKNHAAAHDPMDPPPGTGRLPVCRNCGAKLTRNLRNSACDGMQNEHFEPTRHDYDPY